MVWPWKKATLPHLATHNMGLCTMQTTRSMVTIMTHNYGPAILAMPLATTLNAISEAMNVLHKHVNKVLRSITLPELHIFSHLPSANSPNRSQLACIAMLNEIFEIRYLHQKNFGELYRGYVLLLTI